MIRSAPPDVLVARADRVTPDAVTAAAAPRNVRRDEFKSLTGMEQSPMVGSWADEYGTYDFFFETFFVADFAATFNGFAAPADFLIAFLAAAEDGEADLLAPPERLATY